MLEVSVGRCGLGLALLVLGMATAASDLAGQAGSERFGDCDFRSFRLLNSSDNIAGYRVTWVGLPDLVCSDGVRIRADSAVYYESLERAEFIGGFRYEDSERVLSSVDADYLQQQGQLFARGRAELQTRDGETVVRGDTLTLNEREEGPEDDELVVSGRPAFARLTAAPADSTSTGEPAAPFEVTAPRMSFQGQDQFFASGDVVVDQDSLHATTSALSFDRATGNLQMTGEAHLESGEAVFDAESMSLYLPGGEVRSISLDESGRMVSDDIELIAEHIQAEISDGKMQHLVAVHRDAAEDLARPQATARDFVLSGDSLDVVAPDGLLRTVDAVGDARGVSMPPARGGSPGDEAEARPEPPEAEVPDSVDIDPSILAYDWIEGDTIHATFQPAEGAAAEGAEEYVLDQLVATGNARSLYRSPPQAEDEDVAERPVPDRSRWSISYVLGDRIALTLVDGTVESAEADNAVGLYQEPVQPEAEAADGDPEATHAPADPEVNP